MLPALSLAMRPDTARIQTNAAGLVVQREGDGRVALLAAATHRRPVEGPASVVDLELTVPPSSRDSLLTVAMP